MVFNLFILSIYMLMLSAIARRIPPNFFSPFYINSLLTLIIFTAGYLFYDDISREVELFERSALAVAQQSENDAAFTFVITYMLVSGVVFYCFSTPNCSPNLLKSTNVVGAIKVFSVKTRHAVLSCFLTTIFLTAGIGVDNFLYRNFYQDVDNSIRVLLILGSIFVILSAFVCGLGFAKAGSANKFILLALVSGLVVEELALSSRTASILPLCFVAGYRIRTSLTLRSKIVEAVSLIVVVPVLLNMALYLRSQSEQGILPLGWHFLSAGLWEYLYTGLLYVLVNILVAFPLTVHVGFYESPLPMSYFLTSVNPLPGNFTDWYDIFRMISSFMPYNFYGELVNYGWAAGIGVAVAMGMAWAVIDHEARVYHAKGDYFRLTLLVILSLLTTLTSFQYGFRNTIRPVYYILLIVVLSRFRFRKQRIQKDS